MTKLIQSILVVDLDGTGRVGGVLEVVEVEAVVSVSLERASEGGLPFSSEM